MHALYAEGRVSFHSDSDGFLFRLHSFNIKVQSQLLGKFIKARNYVAKQETHSAVCTSLLLSSTKIISLKFKVRFPDIKKQYFFFSSLWVCLGPYIDSASAFFWEGFLALWLTGSSYTDGVGDAPSLPDLNSNADWCARAGNRYNSLLSLLRVIKIVSSLWF